MPTVRRATCHVAPRPSNRQGPRGRAIVPDVTGELDPARDLGARESGLAVVVTTRSDGTAQATVVNAGVLEHPVTGAPVVGFVVRGRARKLDNLRRRPAVTVVFRSGWDWATVEGTAEIASADDELEGFARSDLPQLLRGVYAAAVGGRPEDWAALDDVLASERHTAVLVRPTRVYRGSGGAG